MSLSIVNNTFKSEMAGFEIDPVFSKALKLLHSNNKDSADQIMHLLEEVIQQKYGGTKSLNLKCGSLLVEESRKSLDAGKGGRPSRGSSPVQAQMSEKSSRDSSPPSEPVSSRTSPDLDDGDLALEIFEDDLYCTVCKGMVIGPRNQLVECNECHLLYHQECHKPPISESDFNDPRLVWYCSECVKKNQEKVQSKVKTVHSEPTSKKSKSEVQSDSKTALFKRNDKSSPSSSSHSKSSNAGGMAHLAASIQGSKSSSSSGISSSSKSHSGSSSSSRNSASLNYSKNPGSPNPKSQSGSAPAPANIIAADKRLQNMKKKAAAKMQEKRSKHK